MEITEKIQAQALLMYVGNEVKIPDGSIHILTGIHKHNDKWWFSFDGNAEHYLKIQYCKIILKSLSSITDEDMIWVYDTCHNLHEQRKVNREHVIKNSLSIEDMKANLNNGFAHYKGGYLSDSAVHQYLILKGYDVPQLLLGYKTLQEYGLAIYESIKK